MSVISNIIISQDWPKSFDFTQDDTCQNIIKPWILEKFQDLKTYDKMRRAGNTYIFHEHALRVADNVARFCNDYLSLDPQVTTNLRWAVLLHDIGKTQIPPDAWDSEEKPTDAMKKLRRTHTLLGAQIIQEELIDYTAHPFVQLMTEMAAYHHEHLDGSGEHGLKHDHLSLPIRLVAIIEAYDGYRIPRPHFGDRIINPEAVLKKLKEEKGPNIFDFALLEPFSIMKIQDWNNGYIRENRPPETYAYVLK